MLIYPFLISSLLINGKQRKLVKADKIISGCNPIFGNKKAPVNPLAVPAAKLLILHNKANEVASFPDSVAFAIHDIIIRWINMPKIA